MTATPDAAEPLTRSEIWKLWRRTLILAALCAVAFGWGMYGIAPGGEYTFYGIEKHSWNPATYQWFFQNIFAAISMAVMGTFGGVFYAVVAVPIGAVVAAFLWLISPLRPIARRWIALDWQWLTLFLAASWFVGLFVTIHAGVNPGICC